MRQVWTVTLVTNSRLLPEEIQELTSEQIKWGLDRFLENSEYPVGVGYQVKDVREEKE